MAVNMVTTFLQFGILHYDRKCKCKCPECGKKLRVYKTKTSFQLNDGWLIYTETRLVCLSCKLRSMAWDLNAVDLAPKAAFKCMADAMQPFDGKEIFGEERWVNEVSKTEPNILNIPTYAAKYRFIVYFTHKGEHWFHRAFNDSERAEQVATDIGGYVYDKEGGETS